MYQDMAYKRSDTLAVKDWSVYTAYVMVVPIIHLLSNATWKH